MAPRITEVEFIDFTYPIKNTRLSNNATSIHGVTSAANLAYHPEKSASRHYFAIRIETDIGITGEYVGRVGNIGGFGDRLIGENPLDRERIWVDCKEIGPIDIALWDFSGKYHDSPIHQLIGTYRTELPAYASASQGDENGGLDTPGAYADFAEECKKLGYTGFKIHSWIRDSGVNNKEYLQREKQTIRTIRDRVGENIDVMLDPFGQYKTLSEAIQIGRVCDNNSLLWYEDPCSTMTRSQSASRKLRQLLTTPVMETESVHGIQAKTDFLRDEATDFLRVNPEFDGGITGAVKAARIAEGFGLDVEYHAVGPAQRHCMAVTRNTNYYEVNLLHPNRSNVHYPPVYDCDYSDEIDAINEDGAVPVPHRPGLGVSYDWDYIYENAVETTRYK